MNIIFTSRSLIETKRVAERLAPYVLPGTVIALSGGLGSGKTSFAACLAEALGVKEHVISPTFNIMRSYFSGRLPFFHIDAYRLNEGNRDLGLSEFIEGDGICVIEWPEYIRELIPQDALFIEFAFVQDNVREMTVTTENGRYDMFIKGLHNA